MSTDLETAQEMVAAGKYKEAKKSLARVELLARNDLTEARGLIGVATTIREKGGRRERKDCDWLIFKAQQTIDRLDNGQ